jgi:DnaA-homolog protein
MQQLPLGVRLRDRASFESFLRGPNGQVVDALQAVACYRGHGCHWLCGAAAAGKSHLLQAVFATAAQQGTAAFLPLSELQALGADTLGGWQSVRVLCVDDVDAVLGDRQWERALLGLYHDAEERGAAIVLSAVAPPAQCGFALPDLASRWRAASIWGLRPLSEPEQREALQLRARLRGLELPEECASFLQRHQPRDMAYLCQLLDALDIAALSAQRRLTVPFIREVLQRHPA